MERYSDEDLRGILMSFGIEDTTSLSREELEMYMQTFQSSMGLEQDVSENPLTARDVVVDLTGDDDTSPTTYNFNPDDAMSESRIDAILNNMDNSANLSSILSPDHPSSSSVMPAEDVVINELTEEQEGNISMFCELTGSERSYAQTMLEATAWNLETAVSLYMDGGQQPIDPEELAASEQRSIPAFQPSVQTSTVFPPVPTDFSDAMSRLNLNGGESDDMNADFERFRRELHRNMGHGEDDSEEEDHSSFGAGRGRRDQYDEFGVRKPDPVRIQRLISDERMRYDDEQELLGRADDPSVDWFFEPPRSLNSILPLEQTRNLGKQEGRWILVNIQAHTEFASHELNRDTWTNETIQDLMRTSYILWQRGHTTEQGKEFMRTYKVNEDHLPSIFIINPRTGAKLFTWTGFIAPDELALKLVDFQDKYQLKAEATQAPYQDGRLSDASDADRKSLTADEKPSSKSDAKAEASVEAAPPAESKKESKEEKAEEKVDFGEVPTEPTDAGAVKVSIKLSNGKAVNRKYNKTDSIRSLFAVALANDAALAHGKFDLISRFPALNLSEHLNSTIGDCNLAGGQVFYRTL